LRFGKAPYAARPAGYRPHYGGDGFYMDRPKPRSNTSDTARAEAASAHGTYSPIRRAVNFTVFGREYWCVVGMLCDVWLVRGGLGHH